ncbi:HPr family phosphocarrier protein [Caproicibacter sp.]|uniref:HPr family phosphocarrier protein n=1 Tax=Caproicibacter sp. TaxID=2814884 RepID=UPI003988E3C8
MIQIKITAKNGLHARPASLVASIARSYPGKIYLEKGGARCDAKNILSVMALELTCGDVVIVTACGEHGSLMEKRIEAAIRNFDQTE